MLAFCQSSSRCEPSGPLPPGVTVKISFSSDIERGNCDLPAIATSIYHKGHDINSGYEIVDNCTSQWSDTGVTVSTTVNHFSYYVVALKEIENTQLPFLTVTYKKGSTHNPKRSKPSPGYITLHTGEIGENKSDSLVCNLSSQNMHLSYVPAESKIGAASDSFDLELQPGRADDDWIVVTVKIKPEDGTPCYSALPAYDTEPFAPVIIQVDKSTPTPVHVYTVKKNARLREVWILCTKVLQPGQLFIITKCAVRSYGTQSPPVLDHFTYKVHSGVKVSALVHKYANRKIEKVHYHDDHIISNSHQDDPAHEMGNNTDSLLEISEYGIKLAV
jgi:hypothetical protein